MFGHLAGKGDDHLSVGGAVYATAILVLGYLVMIGFRDRLTSACSGLARR